MQWQPIDTAPKDGRTVLVGRDVGDPWGFVYGAGYFHATADPILRGWICRGLKDPPGELGLGNPTHWMPIPAPPKAANDVEMVK